MVERPENPTAFPTQYHPDSHAGSGCAGMTLRDWFAGQALAGILGNAGLGSPGGFSFGTSHPEQNEQIAGAVYAVADAMLTARKTGDGQ